MQLAGRCEAHDAHTVALILHGGPRPILPSSAPYSVATISFMATAPNLVSIDEYLDTSYSPDREYIDGLILERNVGKGKHSLFRTFSITSNPSRCTS